MSKINQDKALHYELLYLISNQYTEDEAKQIAKKVAAIIEKKGGKIVLSEEWGKKRLAYPIKSSYYGYYVLVEFNAEKGKLAEINYDLEMTREVLRHQTVIKKIKSKEEIEEEKEVAQKIAARLAAEKKEAEEKERVKDKRKIELGDLDEKLDKILDTKDLL